MFQKGSTIRIHCYIKPQISISRISKKESYEDLRGELRYNSPSSPRMGSSIGMDGDKSSGTLRDFMPGSWRSSPPWIFE